jgi:DNA-binding NarL/FixJ family response regulator
MSDALNSTFLHQSPCDPIKTLAPVERYGEALPATWPHFLKGQANRPVRVLLIDDDVNMRSVVANELFNDRRCDLIAQGSSIREGKRLIDKHEFDVMLVDINLGDGHGFALIEHMKIRRPMAEAIVISCMEDEQHALQAFALGATGYLIKNSWFGSFPQAVLQVVNGGASITPNLARRLLRRLEETTHPKPQMPGDSREHLSDRETGVLKMVASGYTSEEIALKLTISCQTVNTHIKNIYRKLQVHSRAQAVSCASHLGLI